MVEEACGPVSRDPDLEAELHFEAWRGLEQADLKPLALLLRSGFVLDEHLALDIADAIEGANKHCRISAGRPGRGKPAGDQWVLALRNGKIAYYVTECAEQFGFESAVSAAKTQFGFSRAGITDALRAAETFRSRLPVKSRPYWDEQCKQSLEADIKRLGG